MKNFMESKLGRELLFGMGSIVLVVLMTFIGVKKIHQREDLALLQIDFTDVMMKAKLCFDEGGIVQDPSQGREGQVFICNNQNIIEDTFPVLKELSGRGFGYRYLSSQKCLPTGEASLNKKCIEKGKEGNKGGRINIGRGRKLILSCNVAEGVCVGR